MLYIHVYARVYADMDIPRERQRDIERPRDRAAERDGEGERQCAKGEGLVPSKGDACVSFLSSLKKRKRERHT